MAFAIYDVPVGDGQLGIAPMPRGVDDLDVIAAWGASIVITMTTNQELDAEQMSDLGRSVTSRGMQWDHVPVADYGVPGPMPQSNKTEDVVGGGHTSVQQMWAFAAKRAVLALRDGESVLVHCKGGCGRSGMAALRLMILMGEAPDAALSRLRVLRPCAVETDDQMAWAMRPSEQP